MNDMAARADLPQPDRDPAAPRRVLMCEAPDKPGLNPFFPIVFLNPAYRAGAHVEAMGLGLLPPKGNDIHLHWLEWHLHRRGLRHSELVADLVYRNFIRMIDRRKRRGGRVVWTAHNLTPHDFPKPFSKAVFERWKPELLARIDTVTVMSASAEPLIRTEMIELANADFRVIPHPHYRDFYRRTGERTSVREKLNVPMQGFLLASVGLMRGYKQLPEVVRAFAAAARDDEYLVLAGACPPDLRPELERLAGTHPRVRFQPTSLSDREFADLVHDCDLCVMNFSTVLNSGSVIAALSLDTPALAPATGALPDLRAMVGERWVRLFEGPLDADTLRRHVDALREKPVSGEPDLTALDPARIARAYLETYG